MPDPKFQPTETSKQPTKHSADKSALYKQETASLRAQPQFAHWTLPVELLETIFIIVCDTLHEYSFIFDYQNTYPTSARKYVVERPPMILSQVSRHWRDVVYNSPRCWSSICVELYKLPPKFELPQILKIYLHNSKATPLRLSISHKNNGERRLHTRAQMVWDILSRHLSRCISLALEMWTGRLILQPQHEISFPLLEHFCDELIESESGYWEWLRAAIEHASRLRSVSHESTPRPSLPYTQLTKLDIQILYHGPQHAQFLSVIASCSSLITLRIFEFQQGVTSFPTTTIIELPLLRTLVLHDDVYQHPTDQNEASLLSVLLDCLKVPALVDLEVRTVHWTNALFRLTGQSPRLERMSLSFDECGPRSSPRDVLPRLLIPLLDLRIFEFYCNLRIDETVQDGDIDESERHDSREGSEGVADSILSAFLGCFSEPTSLPDIESIRLTFSHISFSDVVEPILVGVSLRQHFKEFRLVRTCREPTVPKFEIPAGLFPRLEEFRNNGVTVTIDDDGWVEEPES